MRHSYSAKSAIGCLRGTPRCQSSCLPFAVAGLLFMTAPLSAGRPAPASPNDPPPKSVLLLHSFHPDTDYTILQRRAIVETIVRKAPRTDIRNEYLDVSSADMENAFDELRDVLRVKFRHDLFDLIICTDTAAFQFLTQHGEELFPRVPIVFSALVPAELAAHARGREITGVMERVEIAATVRLMRRLMPTLERIVIVNDTKGHGNRLQALANEALREFEGQIRFEEWLDQRVEGLTDRVARLAPQRDAVLFLAGGDLWPDQLDSTDTGLSAMCRASPVPVYAVYDAYLGSGIVGGVFASGEAMGQTAAELALRVLAGERASNIPIVWESPNRTMFDATALGRWGISEASLPPGSIVHTEPPSFARKYGWLIAAGIVCLLVELAIIASLVNQRRLLRKSEKALRSNEARLRLLIENSPAAIAMFDCDMRYIVYSRRWLTDYNLPHESIVGLSHYEVFPDIPDRWKEIHQRCLRGARESLREDCFVRSDGTSVWINWGIEPWRDDHGRIGGIIMFTEVITERRQLASELSHFFDLSMDVLCVMDEHGRFHRVNRAFSAILGYQPDELLRQPLIAFVHPDDHAATTTEFLKKLSREAVIDFENRVVRKDGSIRWLQWRATSIASDGLCHAVARDITDRRASEQSLRESERRLALVLDATSEGIWDWNIQTGEDFFSDQWVKALGYTREDIIPHVSFWASIVHPDDMPVVLEALQDHLTGKKPLYRCENRLRMQSGEYRWNLACGRIVEWDEYGRPLRMMGTDSDISGRKAAEFALHEANELLQQRVLEKTAALRESEERLFRLANAAFEGIAIHENGQILAANQSFGDLFGYRPDELIGMTRPELMVDWPPDGQFPEPSAGEASEEKVCESIGTRRDGSTFPCELRAKWMPYQGRYVRVTAVRDITERRRAAQAEAEHRNELAHAMRRVTLGELASGLAHELNQPLAAIVNYTNACLRIIERNREAREEISDAMRQVATQAQRAGDIIRRMRNFVWKGEPQRAEVDINDVVRDALRFMDADFRAKGISVQLLLAEGIEPVRADFIQLEQVILNLLRNATDALGDMPEAERTISIESSRDADGVVVVRVADNGPGIAAEVCSRLFVPFCSTKAKGMGLGLSISRGIVEAHGGRLTFDSKPGGGARFTVRLPAQSPRGAALSAGPLNREVPLAAVPPG